MKLYIVGFGPGNAEGMTIAAWKCLEQCDVIVGYTVYTELLKEIWPRKEYYDTPMRGEVERVRMAIRLAKEGRKVSLVCSGDSVLYGMAGLAYQLAEQEAQKERMVQRAKTIQENAREHAETLEIKVIAGVTAAMSGSAILGAPLTNDVCIISLSDWLTPWETIEKRILCAAQADFEIVFYNPVSKKRAGHLRRACELLLRYRSEDCVCGYVRNIGREGEEARVMTLGELKESKVDMFTTVFIGSSRTENRKGKMITPRGYQLSDV